MPNSLYQFLANDHDRIDKLFHHAVDGGIPIDSSAYDEFRKALLRHISIEEKIVYPAVLYFQKQKTDPVITQFRLEHNAIVVLLVPSPSRSIVATLSSILARHNSIEEQTDGVYEMLDRLPESVSGDLLEQFQNAPEVPILPTRPLSQVIDAVQRTVSRSGHVFIDQED